MTTIEDVLEAAGDYFDCGVNEGRERREVDTPDGTAQKTLGKLRAAIEQYAAERVAEARKPLTDEQIENCIDAANRKFNSRHMGPCGQQMTTYDDWKYWLVHEIENAHGIGEQQNG